jgi:hypothetical protein
MFKGRPIARAVGAGMLLLWATACVSTHMKQFIGQDVRYIAVQDGLPANVFDMPDGRRAFQYRLGGGQMTMPATTTTNGQVQLVGDSAFYSEQKLTTGGGTVVSEGCLVTYFAAWDAAANGWIVRDISYPKRLVC